MFIKDNDGNDCWFVGYPIRKERFLLEKAPRQRSPQWLYVIMERGSIVVVLCLIVIGPIASQLTGNSSAQLIIALVACSLGLAWAMVTISQLPTARARLIRDKCVPASARSYQLLMIPEVLAGLADVGSEIRDQVHAMTNEYFERRHDFDQTHYYLAKAAIDKEVEQDTVVQTARQVAERLGCEEAFDQSYLQLLDEERRAYIKALQNECGEDYESIVRLQGRLISNQEMIDALKTSCRERNGV